MSDKLVKFMALSVVLNIWGVCTSPPSVYTQSVINLTINLISKGKHFSFVFHYIYVIVCNVKC